MKASENTKKQSMVKKVFKWIIMTPLWAIGFWLSALTLLISIISLALLTFIIFLSGEDLLQAFTDFLSHEGFPYVLVVLCVSLSVTVLYLITLYKKNHWTFIKSATAKKVFKRILYGILWILAFAVVAIAFLISRTSFNLPECERNVENILRTTWYSLFSSEDLGPGAEKPIIYLYPTQTTNVTVKLGNPDTVIHTYPKYNGPWQVQAEPNGDLIDLKTNRKLYALYWESRKPQKRDKMREGFCIPGKDTIPFLEEKLAILGLTEHEAEEMIIYWLPRMENAPYNYIRFQTMAEQDKNMPLLIEPKPQTVIRVMMEYTNLSRAMKVKEQILPPTPVRNGFTVVEWGGIDLRDR